VRTLDGKFHSFEYEIDCEEKLVVRAEGEGFVLAREPIVYQTETVIVCGNITTSLFEAAGQIGEAPVLVMKLVEIFGWDVDFVLDVREGDTFKAIVEKRYRNGEFAGYGKIPAAEFVNQGKTYQAFLFENREGHTEYYDAKGRSLRRAFLKTPLDYARVSSSFSWNRFHPIKKEWCPHPAIDYAAPVGTPVRTVGDGVVLEAGRKKASGKYVKIRHNSMYQTYYLHLSRFGKGIRSGKRVRQGQVIGYVGNTGMSTGPHLDFRMKKNGRYVNPRRVIAPASPPVPKERIEEYRNTIQPLLAHLDATAVPVAMETSAQIPESHEDEKSHGREDRSMYDARGGL
jgi:murein DD-endopeptidase MepM/ murein hydrolase activator NlpD